MILALALSATLASSPASCESLKSLSLPNTTITTADAVDAGKLTLPASTPPPARATALGTLPALCRVAATIRPSADSDIRIEVWMPASGWNGAFQAAGNGGWSGAIAYSSLVTALKRGYATASTDTGHVGLDASFALGHPEKLVDFAWRSEHEMTVAAKAIVAAFYGTGPKRSYWNGCSSGGKQGLKEAQRFPADYDGIIAGAPANYWTHLMASGVWIGQATLKDSASYIPREKYAVLHRAALDACDAGDGVTDGLIEDPIDCRFDPQVLQCRSKETPTCLTALQVAAARKIYSGPKNPRTGESIFPGLEPGSELGWGAMAGGPEPFQITSDHFKYIVFRDPKWDFNRSRSAEILCAWREASLVPGVERSIDRAAERTQLLPQRGRFARRRVARGELDSPLYGSRHGALQRRRGAELVRHAQRA